MESILDDLKEVGESLVKEGERLEERCQRLSENLKWGKTIRVN